MALFSRRIVNRYLEEAARLVSARKLHDWVQRLNTVSDDYVATEWEIVLLCHFAKFGHVRSEPAEYGTLDLLFEASDGQLCFAAEITTISDQTAHARNPVDQFRVEFSRQIRKARIETGRFSFHVGEVRPIPARGTGRRRQLLLPSPRQFSAHIFNPEFKRFLEIVKSTPTEKHSHHVRNDSPAIDLRVDYEPGASGGIGVATYGMYTSTTVRDDNPLYNALKHKADQLRRGGFPGVRGVIVCDRACQIFHESRNWATYSMDEIVREFFRQNDSVAFVITLGIKSAGNGLEYRPNLFVRELGPPWISGLGRLLKNVLSSLPPPCETPGNALNDLKWNKSTKRTRPYIGGWELQGNRIRMSTREVLDLLAGVLDQKRFCERYEVAGGNIFSRFRAEGKMISRAEVERRPEKDEDWIILEFSADDPAVSDFKVPKSPGR